ncbi:MAG: hypothetical protein J6Q94_02915 [Clostridia bacterium]|nr:hypothetical protein [Clostridia bacterium]
MELRECKRCLLLQSGDEDNHKMVQQYIAKIRPEEKCDEELYQKRLEICGSCDNLISGTCIKCGCYVEFRAAFRLKHCPDTKNKKW